MKPTRLLAFPLAPAALAAAFALTLILAAAHAGPAAADPGSLPLPAATPPPSGGGGPTRGGDVLLSMPRASQVDPAVAYNTEDSQFLLVWTDDRDRAATGLNIYGQLFSEVGVPLGEPFFVSNAAGDQSSPDVAYLAHRDEYMVVWEDCRKGAGDCDIYGQRVAANGALMGAIGIAISTAAGGQQAPAIASGGDTHKYEVVWQDGRRDDMGWEIYGQLVDYLGNLVGENEWIISAVDEQTHPDVVFGKTKNEGEYQYVVVAEFWLYATRTDLVAARLDTGGIPFGGQPHVVGALENGDLNLDPAIVWNATDNEYLLVYQHTPHLATPLLTDIRAVRLSPTLDSASGILYIVEAVGNQSHPEVAHNAVSNEYLLTWQEGRFRGVSGWDIYGERMDHHCIPLGRGEFPISRAADDQFLPAVAFNPSLQQTIVFWSDQRTGQFTHIYGQRISRAGLPAGHGFGAVAAPGSQEDPAVAYNSVEEEYLAVWADERGDSPDIYGQRYDAEGRLLGDNTIVYQAEGEQIRPAVAYNSLDNSYLVVWEDAAAAGSIMGRMMGPQGNPLAAPFRVSAGSVAHHWPAVAYNSTPDHNNFMVVYECDAIPDPPNEYGSDLCLRLVSAAGVPDVRAPRINQLYDNRRPAVVYNSDDNEYLLVNALGSTGAIKIWAERWNALGEAVDPSGSEVSNHGVLAAAPALAYNPEDNRYLVLWTEYVTEGHVLRGRILGADESLIGLVFTANTGTSLAGDSAGAGLYFPATNRYRVVWEDGRIPETSWDIWGQWVEANGAVIPTPDLPIFRYTGWQRNPDIALGLPDGEAFTLWQDGRNGVSSDIYGRLGALDHTPPVPAFTTDPTRGRAGAPFTFDASASRDDLTPPGALVVRWDFQNDGVWDTEFSEQKTVTHTFTIPGVYTVTLQVRDWAALTSKVGHAVAVLPQSAALAPAAAAASAPIAALTVDPAYAEAGASFTADASGSTGGANLRVRWDWENDGVWDASFSGTLTASHTYTVADDVVIRAEVLDDTGLTGAALRIVTVLPGEPATLQVSPGAVRLTPGQSVRFRANAWDAYGNRLWNPEVVWSPGSGDAGTLDDAGWFTAGARPGFYPDAVAATLAGLTEQASVTVFWPQEVYLPVVLR